MLNSILVFISMAAWSVFHSWLAAFQTKNLAKRFINAAVVDRFYRLFFVLTAMLTLLPILAMAILLSTQVLWQITPPWIYVSVFVQVLTLAGLIAGVFHTDVMAFVGLRQLVNPEIEQESKLVVVGLYRFVRHPLYFFGLILIWLMPIMTDTLLALNIAASLYLILGTIPEEKKLVAMYGPAYQAYQKEVPRIIPFLKF